MKKLVSTMLVFILITFFLPACQKIDNQSQNQPEEKSYELSLATLQESLNKQRENDLQAPLFHTVEDFGTIEENEKADFSEEELEKFSTIVHYQNKITLEEALEDVDQMMRLLKTSYAGYNYFGGDKRFNEARAQIEKRVRETYSEDMSITYPFYLIIKEELAFIEDSRFRIGRSDSYFKKKDIYYETDKKDFVKDDNGYYTVIEGKKWYLKEGDVQNIHVTVNNQGDLVYGLFQMTDNEKTLPDNICLRTLSGEESVIKTTWTIAHGGPKTTDFNMLYSYYDIEGIPVSAITRMSLDFHDYSRTNDFINDAKELKNKEVFILDLRNNRGGVNEIADFFLYNLTGEKCESKMQLVTRYNSYNKKNEEIINNTKELSDFSKIDFYNDNKEMVDSWITKRKCGKEAEDGKTIVIDNNAKWHDCDNTIIVLINHTTMAQAEYFLAKLATLNNVVIMGTNSGGYMITDGDIDEIETFLYNTGIPFNFGSTLMIHDKMDGFDTNGWVPDIITRGDALEAAVAMVNNQ